MAYNNFDKLSDIMNRLNGIEDDLKGVRDNVSRGSQKLINKTISRIFPVRDELWRIDKNLEEGGGI